MKLPNRLKKLSFGQIGTFAATIIGIAIAVASVRIANASLELDRRAAQLEFQRQQLEAEREQQLGRIRYVGQFSPGESLRMVSTNERHILDMVDIVAPSEVTTHFIDLKVRGDTMIDRRFFGDEFVERIDRNTFELRYRDLHTYLQSLVPEDGSIDGVPSRVPLAIRTVFYDNNVQRWNCGRYVINYENLRTSAQPITLHKPRLAYVGDCGPTDRELPWVNAVWLEERSAKGHTGAMGQIKMTTTRLDSLNRMSTSEGRPK